MSEPESATQSLSERLRARIRREGPISFRDWMQSALYDSEEGYYVRKDRVRWGREGDYRTAPETSSLFASTFARYFAKLFGDLGSPSHWTILEAGAGSGEFADGVLSFLQANHQEIFAATNYLIDEISGTGREQIREKLAPFAGRAGFRTLAEIESPVTGIVFSNELLDAFPVHRVLMTNGNLREIYVGLNSEDAFEWTEGELTNQYLSEYVAGASLAEGQIVEVNPQAAAWIERASAILDRGFIISVDYGADQEELVGAPHRRQGTLRAFKKHQLSTDPLASPGEQDLTTTVDWTQIQEAGTHAGLTNLRFARLDQFLMNEGLIEELETATRAQTEAEAARLRLGAREMIMPGGLASAFQVLVQEKLSVS